MHVWTKIVGTSTVLTEFYGGVCQNVMIYITLVIQIVVVVLETLRIVTSPLITRQTPQVQDI